MSGFVLLGYKDSKLTVSVPVADISDTLRFQNIWQRLRILLLLHSQQMRLYPILVILFLGWGTRSFGHYMTSPPVGYFASRNCEISSIGLRVLTKAVPQLSPGELKNQNPPKRAD